MPKVWDYSGAIYDYPVEPGDVWQQGDHIFICGDLEGESPLDEILDANPLTLLYVDPPWGNSMATSYRTKARADGDKGRPARLEHLLPEVIRPAARFGLDAYIETGIKEQDTVETAIRSLGGTVTGVHNITYYYKHPGLLVGATFNQDEEHVGISFDGLDDDDTPTHAMTHYGTGCVLDTCAGRGLTARSAQVRGWRSINHELSPYRMAEAMKSVQQLSGLEPEKR